MLERDDDLGRLEVFRARLRHSLPARFLLRYHLSLVVAASIVSGWALDVFLLHRGMRMMIVRYPIAIACSYGVFVLGIGAWLRYSGIAEYIDRRKAEELVGDDVPHAAREEPGWLGGVDPTIGLYFGDGCFIAALVLIAVLVLGGYTILTAPTFFADVVLEVLLAAGLVRGVRRARESGWISGVWANTWGSVVIALVLAFFAGLFALGLQPHPTTMAELWRRMHGH